MEADVVLCHHKDSALPYEKDRQALTDVERRWWRRLGRTNFSDDERLAG